MTPAPYHYGKQATTNIDEVIKNIENSDPMDFVHLGADGGLNRHMTGHHNPFGLLIAEVRRLREQICRRTSP